MLTKEEQTQIMELVDELVRDAIYSDRIRLKKKMRKNAYAEYCRISGIYPKHIKTRAKLEDALKEVG